MLKSSSIFNGNNNFSSMMNSKIEMQQELQKKQSELNTKIS